MKTFEEILKHPVEKEDTNVFMLMGCYYSYLYQNIDPYNLDRDRLYEQTRVTVKYYKDFCFDGRRVWRLYSVWFDGQLVMLCKNAGREGDDHTGFAVFDKDLYNQLNSFVKSFELNEEEDHLKTCQLTDNADDFYSFYGEALNSTFKYW